MFAIALILIVTAHNLQLSSSAVTKIHEPVIYPEPLDGPIRRFDDDGIPVSCKHLNYCTEKPRNYPEDTFNEMFKGYKMLPQPALIKEIKFETRITGGEEDKNDCDSVVTFEPLYIVRDKRDQAWRTVIQAPGENFVQRVRLETCKNANSPCFTIFPALPEVTTFCKQQYNTWKLLVSKPDNTTEEITTELPVCCSCHYKSSISFSNRFGNVTENN